MLDTILFPLGGNFEQAKDLIINSEIKEFYTGLANDNLNGCSYSHHYSPIGCFNRRELKELFSIASYYNKTITVAMNIFFYTNEIKKDLIDDFSFLSKFSNLNNIIIGNLEIYWILKKYFPQIKTSASSLFGIKNTEAANLFYNLGFNRIILSRNININEIKNIAKELSTKIEIEVFIYGGGCNFCEGTCHLPHVYIGELKGSNENIILSKSPIPICSFPVKIYKNNRFITISKIHIGNRRCGICYVNKMKEIGISKFKITGRTINKGDCKTLLGIINERINYDNIDECNLDKFECLYGKERF